MKRKTKIVLDTSIFVNPDARRFFGKSPDEAFSNFLESLKGKKHLTCYMPPSVYEELMKFMERDLPLKKTVLLHKKPPASYQAPMPALFLYEFIEEMRKRMNKGLRITEKYIRKGLAGGEEQAMIKAAREEYRVALREGVIDSTQDCDLLLLAKETHAFLTTADVGLIHWAHKLGIKCLSAQELKEIIE